MVGQPVVMGLIRVVSRADSHFVILPVIDRSRLYLNRLCLVDRRLVHGTIVFPIVQIGRLNQIDFRLVIRLVSVGTGVFRKYCRLDLVSKANCPCLWLSSSLFRSNIYLVGVSSSLLTGLNSVLFLSFAFDKVLDLAELVLEGTLVIFGRLFWAGSLSAVWFNS